MALEEQPFGFHEDLIAELEFKLNDILSHIKPLSNATCTGADFEIKPDDINALGLTIHDKTINAIFTLEKLKASLNNLPV